MTAVNNDRRSPPPTCFRISGGSRSLGGELPGEVQVTDVAAGPGPPRACA